MPDRQNLIPPNLCQNASLLHGKICKLKRVICMQTMHENIGRISLGRDSAPVQGLLPQSYRYRKPSILKRDDMQVETESISQTVCTSLLPLLDLELPPIQTQCNPYHQDTISVGSTLLYNHPPTLHNTTTRMISQLQK